MNHGRAAGLANSRVMMVGPCHQSLHGLQERASEVSQCIFHARWHFCIQRATDETIIFKAFERARQHLARDIADFPIQFIETQCALRQCLQNQQAPLVADPVENIADRTGLIEAGQFGGGHAGREEDEGKGQYAGTRSHRDDFLWLLSVYCSIAYLIGLFYRPCFDI